MCNHKYREYVKPVIMIKTTNAGLMYESNPAFFVGKRNLSTSKNRSVENYLNLIIDDT